MEKRKICVTYPSNIEKYVHTVNFHLCMYVCEGVRIYVRDSPRLYNPDMLAE